MSYPPYGGCLCLVWRPCDLLPKWHARVGPVLQRMVQHGHRLDSKRLEKVALLVVTLENGGPECFSEDARRSGYSHHLKGCKWRGQPVQEV